MSLDSASPALDPVEAAVSRAEARSSAEIVVVLAARSDTYREVPWIVGAVAGLVTLGFLAWAPPTFDGAWFPVDVALVGVVAGWLARRSPLLIRLLVPGRVRHARVQAAAEACFVQEAVHGTRARTGVLVYTSALEDEVVTLADQGVLARVPAAEWTSLRFVGAHEAALVTGLGALGELLARHLPAHDTDNPDEIANTPRRRP